MWKQTNKKCGIESTDEEVWSTLGSFFFLLFCFVCLKIGHKLIAFLLLLVGRCLTYSFLHTLFRLQNTFCVLLISALCLLLCSTDVGVVVYALMRK